MSDTHQMYPFSNLITALDAPSAIADHSGCILSHNIGFAGHILHSYTSLVGKNLTEIWEDDQRLRLGDFLQAIKSSATEQMPDAIVSTLLSAKALRNGDETLILCQSTTPQADDSLVHFFLKHVGHGFWNYDTKSHLFVVSDAWRTMRGIDPDEDINDPGRDWLKDIHPEDRLALKRFFEVKMLGETQSFFIQYRRRHLKTGNLIWFLCRATIISRDDAGVPLRIVGIDTDITEIKKDEEKLAQLNNKFELAIDASGIGIWEFDLNTTRVHWDDRMLEIYGLEPGQNDRSGDSWGNFIHLDDAEETIDYTETAALTRSEMKHDFRIVRPDGEVRHIRTMARYGGMSEAQTKLIGVNIDVTEDVQRALELECAHKQLEYDSRHDVLTGLANRRLLDETFEALIQDLDGALLCMMHLDLDYFKEINDTLGHAAGDAVLVHVARTLERILCDKGLICRLGGDEFAVLFDHAPSQQTLHEIADHILGAFKAPLIYEGHACTFGVSIGSGKARDRETIFARADIALYAAKNAGRSCYRSFKLRAAAPVDGRLRRRQDLLDALANDKIECWYQPQFDAKSHAIVGAEALARLRRSDTTVWAPDEFLPLAQETGLLADIEELILQRVLADQTEWAKLGLRYPTVSVNLSQYRLADATLADQIGRQLKPHHSIALELLETAFLDETDGPAHAMLAALRGLGISLDLDDFGSGHASIVAMMVVKPERIKIDQRLTRHIATRAEDVVTLKALVSIARAHNIGVVLEGIETSEHLSAVNDIDCDVLQGYALSAPIPVNEFAALLDVTVRKAVGEARP